VSTFDEFLYALRASKRRGKGRERGKQESSTGRKKGKELYCDIIVKIIIRHRRSIDLKNCLRVANDTPKRIEFDPRVHRYT